MSILIAKRYSQAFYDWAEDSNNTESVYQDLCELKKLCQESEIFGDFICNPVMSAEEKNKIIQDLFTSKIHSQTMTFLMFLVDKSRINLLEAICNTYELIHLQSSATVEALITSNVKLSDEQLEKIRTRFAKLTGKNIQERTVIDPQMSGGIKIQVEDTIYDYSIENKLQKFRKAVVNQ